MRARTFTASEQSEVEMIKKVTMRHPETGGETQTTTAAFEEVWQEKGWELVDAEATTADSEDEGQITAPYDFKEYEEDSA